MCGRYNHPSTCPSQCHRAAGQGTERPDCGGGPAAEQARPERPPLPGREVLSSEGQPRAWLLFRIGHHGRVRERGLTDRSSEIRRMKQTLLTNSVDGSQQRSRHVLNRKCLLRCTFFTDSILKTLECPEVFEICSNILAFNFYLLGKKKKSRRRIGVT